MVDERASFCMKEEEGKSVVNTTAHVACGTKNKRFRDIIIGSLNIVDGRSNCYKLTCQELKHNGEDVTILTETKMCGIFWIQYCGNESNKSTSRQSCDCNKNK